jgi:hypothetical protein
MDILPEGRTYCRSGHKVGMRQNVHILGWTDNTSILGQNVAVANCRVGQIVARTNHAGRIVA